MLQFIALLILEIIQIVLVYCIFRRLRVIEITKNIEIISTPKKEKPFTPVVIKAKTGVGNHIINDLQHDRE